ncbi:MAG: 4Fe-4S binding protein, partial [Firmicutes bacterium]|nr:4Fe-4S binding protein [Bacillota bacterium]
MPNVTRRQLLRWLGAGGAGVASGVIPFLAAAGQAGDARGTAREQTLQSTGRQWVMVVDRRKCEGCTTIDKPPQCKAACKKEHFVPEEQNWMEVYEAPDQGGGTYFKPRPCQHCEKAPCEHVCPVEATYYNPDGLVLIDHERCIGCRFCLAACPFQARYFN